MFCERQKSRTSPVNSEIPRGEQMHWGSLGPSHSTNVRLPTKHTKHRSEGKGLLVGKPNRPEGRGKEGKEGREQKREIKREREGDTERLRLQFILASAFLLSYALEFFSLRF